MVDVALKINAVFYLIVVLKCNCEFVFCSLLARMMKWIMVPLLVAFAALLCKFSCNYFQYSLRIAQLVNYTSYLYSLHYVSHAYTVYGFNKEDSSHEIRL